MGDTPPPVAIPSQGDLDQIRRRFLALNDKRLALALAELRPQQQDFPRLLPLLFHVNHPLLPGYVSEHTPAGVSGFRMDARQLESARKLARQFQLRNRARRE
jgi:adenylate cyclase class 1